MFRAWCHAEGCEVLLTSRRITGVRRFPGGLELSFSCWCGHAGTVVDRTWTAPSTPTTTATPEPVERPHQAPSTAPRQRPPARDRARPRPALATV